MPGGAASRDPLARLGCLVLALGLASGAIGILEILAPRRALLPTELLLVGLGVIGSLLTPAILAIRFLRRRYWNNSARMLSLLGAIRGPVLAALSVYGIVSLAAQLLDATRARVGAVLPAPNLSGWLGWAPFLFGIALCAALAAALHRTVLSREATPMRRLIAGPVVLGLATTVSVLLAAEGWRLHRADTSAIAAADLVGKERAPVTTANQAEAPEGAATPEATASRAGDSGASAAEIEQAKQGGLSSLTALRARYPQDPAVLEPLAFALAKEPEGASELLRVLDTLFAEAPARAQDEALAKLVLGATKGPATASRAIELMRSRMASQAPRCSSTSCSPTPTFVPKPARRWRALTCSACSRPP